MTKIRALRIENDMTAKAVAEQLKLDQSVLSFVERGKSKASDRVRLKLCKFFGVAETELFNNERFAV
ncbi:helix-turn-helix transcriptional regulator [Cloacibacillus evryensis]|uniref:helix-turn-helix transcriptional regulator n=1 Tax=Cloacibacillus evryensis TaxID=508460 RepID=UPI002109E5BF|nr:helix-turn-helix transcriptional regulator [Cloacibacillus evryensis]MCQ4763530.1 helix-turn-helix domain-containing protein [Cloacibacillus evryensis]